MRLPHQSTSSRGHGQRQCKKLKSRIRSNSRVSIAHNRRSHGCSDVEASDGTQSINRTQDGIKMELRHRAKMPCGLSGFEPHETWFRTHLPPFLRHRHSHCSSWEHAKRECFLAIRTAPMVPAFNLLLEYWEHSPCHSHCRAGCRCSRLNPHKQPPMNKQMPGNPLGLW